MYEYDYTRDRMLVTTTMMFILRNEQYTHRGREKVNEVQATHNMGEREREMKNTTQSR